MSDPTWWTIWGQSATAIGGFVMGVVGVGLGIYNARVTGRKHGWDKQDRENQEQYEKWCREKTEAIRLVKHTPFPMVVVEDDRVPWLQRAHGDGRLKAMKDPSSGNWVALLP